MQAVIDKIEIKRYADEDGTRERGEECRGVVAEATIRVLLDSHPDGTVQLVTLKSGGLWGVEEASDPAYFEEIGKEQEAELGELLAAFGLRLPDDRGHVPYGSDPITDADAMDWIQAKLNEPGQWNGGDVCELVATLCTLTNREIKDEPESDD